MTYTVHILLRVFPARNGLHEKFEIEFRRLNAVVVSGNRVGYDVGITIRVYDGNGGDVHLGSVTNCLVLLVTRANPSMGQNNQVGETDLLAEFLRGCGENF